MSVIIDHQAGSDILGHFQNAAASIEGMRGGEDQKDLVFQIFQLDDRLLEAECPNGGTVVAGGVTLPDCVAGNIFGLKTGILTIIDTVIRWCDKAVLVKKAAADWSIRLCSMASESFILNMIFSPRDRP